MNDEFNKKLLGAKRIAWAGRLVPFPRFESLPEIYDAEFDFRVSGDLHRKFDLVYLVESDLAHFKQWPLILDEALRLLSDHGMIAIRLSQGVHNCT